MFGLSEHCLFDEQRNLLESLSDSYKGKVICSEDNPDFITGKRGHSGVANFLKQTLDDFVSPLETDSDRIVGIQTGAPNQDPLFILSVYFPSSNHQFTEFCECLDLLWSLCEMYINKGPFILMRDFNAQLGNIFWWYKKFWRFKQQGEKTY